MSTDADLNLLKLIRNTSGYLIGDFDLRKELDKKTPMYVWLTDKDARTLTRHQLMPFKVTDQDFSKNWIYSHSHTPPKLLGVAHDHYVQCGNIFQKATIIWPIGMKAFLTIKPTLTVLL